MWLVLCACGDGYEKADVTFSGTMCKTHTICVTAVHVRLYVLMCVYMCVRKTTCCFRVARSINRLFVFKAGQEQAEQTLDEIEVKHSHKKDVLLQESVVCV